MIKSERDWLRTLTETLKNRWRSNGYKERAALQPGRVRVVLAWIGASTERYFQHLTSANIIWQARGG